MAVRKYLTPSTYKTALLVAVSFLLLFGVGASALDAPSPTSDSNPDFVHAIWIVKENGVLKLRAADGKLLFEIKTAPSQRQAAVDERRGVIWILTQKGLHIYGFDGKLRFNVVLRTTEEEKDEHEEQGGRAILLVNPNNGSAWLGVDDQLRHFSEKGELLKTLRLKHPVRALALDKNTNRLWVGTEDTVSAYEDSGTPANLNIDLSHGHDVEDIDIDAGAKNLWVARAGELRRYDITDASLKFAKPIEHLRKVASDSHGGAWLATAQSLLRLDSAGKIVVHRTPFSEKEGDILVLVADPIDRSIWAAAHRTLKHIGAHGADLLTKSFSAPHIRDLALYRDSIPPTLSFTEPADGAQVTTATPQLTLVYSDIGVGVDSSTLSIQANGHPLKVTCSLKAASTTCKPAKPFPLGANTLSATIEDFAGNQSARAKVSFTVTLAHAPQVNAGPGQTITLPATASLQGTVTEDGVPVPPAKLTVQWSVVSGAGNVTFSNPTALDTTASFSSADVYVLKLTASDGALSGSGQVTITVNPAPHAPQVYAGPGQTITLPATASLQGTVTEDGVPVPPAKLTVQWSVVSGAGNVTFSNPTALDTTASFSSADVYVLKLTVSDGALSGSGQVTITVNPAPHAPQVNAGPGQTITLPATALLQATVTEDGVPSPPGKVTVQWSKVSGCGTVTFSNPTALDTTASFSSADAYVLMLTATDGVLSGSGQVTVTANAPAGLPRDPCTVAPPVETGVATTIASSTAFLYLGTDPIQTGVAPDTIVPTRAAVLRGKVLDKTNAPLSGVTITVLSHPEFGQTLSRVDGMFDLAVNGGEFLALNYQKTGFLAAQRQVNVSWQNFALAPDVVLIPQDTQVTAIDLTASTPIQVARGSPMTDSDGTRQATLFFPQGTQATMVMPDGSTRPLATLNVRATEFTVGPNGPNAMPAGLPPTSGYTYAVDFSADEAQAAGADRVQFTHPIPVYVENFLNFPVGIEVPTGSYDGKRGTWVPSDSGRVVKILSITSGAANLDTTGSGTADNGVALGVTAAERQQLASLYGPGQTLWRVPISHFSQPSDCNWPFGPPPDAAPPPGPGAGPGPKGPDPKPDDPCKRTRSVIECQSEVLGETVRVTGTPFSLNYRSDRVPGRAAADTLTILLSGATVPASLKRIDLEIAVAGQLFKQSFPPATNQTATFTWDHRDAYGRTLLGPQVATVQVGYTYNAVYQRTPRFGDQSNGIVLTSNQARQEVTLSKTTLFPIGSFDFRTVGLGAWTLNVHHGYDSIGKVLYLGDGSRQSIDGLPAAITTAPAATASNLSDPNGIALGPDGSLYIADTGFHRIRRVGPDGTITTVAGTGTVGFGGDGGPATAAALNLPRGVALGPDGSLYIADTNNDRIRRVGPDGTITTVAGTGTVGFGGDGGPATAAAINLPGGVALGPDGSLYIADTNNDRIRRVGPDGIIATVAGTGTAGFSGDGGPAAAAAINFPFGVALGLDGSLFIADTVNDRIRRVGPDGIITTVAGTGAEGFGGEGGPATAAALFLPSGVALGLDGSLFIADRGNNRVRQVGPDGIIITVAGNGTSVSNGQIGDGGPATAAMLAEPSGVAIGSDGSLYIADTNDRSVRKVASPLPGLQVSDILVAAEDGGEIYIFTGEGRHQRTLNTLTGAALYEFAYDPNGHLSTVTDGDGNVTTIEHDPSGNPTAIIGPFGQRTTLAVDANGYLASVADPAGETFQMNYTAAGLLTQFTDPNGNSSTMAYDTLGRLTRDTDAGGGFTVVTRKDSGNSHTTSVSTALQGTTTYQVEYETTGNERRVTTFPDATQNTLVIGTDGHRSATFFDGSTYNFVEAPDPRFQMQAPLGATVTISTPGGLTSTSTRQRNASLADPNNLLSLTSESETVAVNGRTYTSSFDAATKTFTLTTPMGRQITMTVDTLGRPLQSQVAGLLPRSFVYDSHGRLSTATSGTGEDARTATINYNSDGNVQTISDPLGRNTSFTYDATNRLTQQTLADGRIITITYDGDDNATSITPPGRPAHGFAFTPVDLTLAYQPPSIGAGTSQTLYAYNVDRQLTSITRPDSQVLNLGYDNAGRLTTLILPTGKNTYTYGPTTGKLATITEPGGSTLSYSYDGSLLRGVALAGPVSGTIGYTYDSNFRIASHTVNGGNAINFIYDNDNLLTNAGTLSLTRSSQNGLITATTLGGVTDTLTYNGFAELTAYSAASNGSQLYSAQYTRDKLGRITQKLETIGGVTTTVGYTYDQASRLSGVTSNGASLAAYTYDSNGNRLTGGGLSSPPTYDAQDRLIQYGQTTYTYTSNGDLASKTAGSQTTTYQYDVLGNPKAVALPDGTKIDYVIDAVNRRVGKKVGGTLVQGFLYQSGLKPIAELDGNNTVISRFVYGTKVNVPDYMIKGSTTYRIVVDHLGSPRLVINSADGSIAQRMDYDEFGRVILDTNPGFQPFGFAGGLYDRDTQLVRFGARDYDAGIGRWTLKDPLGFAAGDTNLYAYVGSDPVSSSDPVGFGKPLLGRLFAPDAPYTGCYKKCRDKFLESYFGEYSRGFADWFSLQSIIGQNGSDVQEQWLETTAESGLVKGGLSKGLAVLGRLAVYAAPLPESPLVSAGLGAQEAAYLLESGLESFTTITIPVIAVTTTMDALATYECWGVPF